MSETKNINGTLDDIIFENRHKAYGAYELRKGYKKVLTRSFIIGSIAFCAVLGSALLYSAAKNSEEVEVNLADPMKIPPPPMDKAAPPPPPPPPPPPEIPKVATTKFTPPEIVPDEQVREDEPPPKQSELEKAPAGSETVEGDPNAVAPVVVEEGPKKEEKVDLVEEEDKIFTVVEQNAEFPGGDAARSAFLQKNLNYPQAAMRANVSGKVFVNFTVDKYGNISDAVVTKGIGFGCDEEALRVVKSMPKWKPGRQSGNAVKSKFTLPISFTLQE